MRDFLPQIKFSNRLFFAGVSSLPLVLPYWNGSWEDLLVIKFESGRYVGMWSKLEYGGTQSHMVLVWKFNRCSLWKSSSVVERTIAVRVVTGSTPVVSFFFWQSASYFPPSHLPPHLPHTSPRSALRQAINWPGPRAVRSGACAMELRLGNSLVGSGRPVRLRWFLRCYPGNFQETFFRKFFLPNKVDLPPPVHFLKFTNVFRI